VVLPRGESCPQPSYRRTGTQKIHPAFLQPHEAQRLIESLPEPCRTVVLVALLTGLRIGEIAALRWERVDFLRGTLQVKETYSEEHGFGSPKTKSSTREVPISEPLRAALLAHRARCSDVAPSTPLFASSSGTPISPKNLAHRVLRPTCVRLGLCPIWLACAEAYPCHAARRIRRAYTGCSGHLGAVRFGDHAADLHARDSRLRKARCSQRCSLIVPFCSPARN